MRCLSNKNGRVKGLTLVEAMIAVVLLGSAAAVVASVFTSGASMYTEGARQTLGAQLASDLMEEIVNTPFDRIVDQYDNLIESKGHIKDVRGDIFRDSNYSNFRRKAKCSYRYVNQQAGQKGMIFIQATVTVYYEEREIANITMLIGEYDDEKDESWTIDFL